MSQGSGGASNSHLTAAVAVYLFSGSPITILSAPLRISSSIRAGGPLRLSMPETNTLVSSTRRTGSFIAGSFDFGFDLVIG